MSNDLQMARGNIEGGHNLAVGEPEFLQERLWFGPLTDFSPSWPYPTIDGNPYLREALQRMYPKRYIVITIGAKQALLAAFYAYKKFLHYADKVVHEPPYWPSYPTLARLSGLEFEAAVTDPTEENWENKIVCVTSPNNPDGKESERICDIWDAVYGSELYGHTHVPEHETAVYSAAKLLGLSGMRIGWLVTTNKEIAEYASHYVEFTTSGVPSSQQGYVAMALGLYHSDATKKRLEQARQDLIRNGVIFNQYLGDYAQDVQGVPTNGTGMFAWFKVPDVYHFTEAMNKAKVRLVSGPACGGDENYFRMSMGLTNDKTEAALKALKACL